MYIVQCTHSAHGYVNMYSIQCIHYYVIKHDYIHNWTITWCCSSVNYANNIISMNWNPERKFDFVTVIFNEKKVDKYTDSKNLSY